MACKETKSWPGPLALIALLLAAASSSLPAGLGGSPLNYKPQSAQMVMGGAAASTRPTPPKEPPSKHEEDDSDTKEGHHK